MVVSGQFDFSVDSSAAASGLIMAMSNEQTSHQIDEPTAEDLKRIKRLLQRVGGDNVVWGPAQALDIWVIEQRARLDQRMSEQIRNASWALVVATVGLVVCTAGLIWVTFAS